MKKVDTTSIDAGNEKLDKLRRIFPQFVKENKIDFDALKKFFEEEEIQAGEEKYGLNWVGKNNAFKLIRIPSVGMLTPQEKESKEWDKTENLFIEGDNLEVLKLLQKYYREKIKMIYIDPPYNTGNDFIYKDNYVENISDYYERTGQSKEGIKMSTNPESAGRYHSNWLTMMYPRLFLARNLLKEDGVIFISIDDNEIANLRLIMDEIFGEENFVGQIIINSNPRGSQEPLGISTEHEYVLCYGKSEESKLTMIGEERNEDDEEFTYIDDKGKKGRLLGLRKRGGSWRRFDRPNMFFPFYVNPKTKKVSLEKTKDNFIEVLPVRPDGAESRWTWAKNTAEENMHILIAKEIQRNGRSIYDIFRIDYLIDEQGQIKTEKIKSIWTDKELNYQYARQYFRELFGSSEIFDFPKSPFLIKKLISILKEKDGIILDFFAGSGTTAHAVMDLNAEDGENRKWIMVQLPEATDEESEAYKAGYETIAAIARERIRRAGKKIGKGDIGFKSFSLSKSNYRQWNILTDKDDEQKLKKQMKLFLEKPLTDRYDEKSVVYEILLKEGYSLNSKVTQEKNRSVKFWQVIDEEKKLLVTFEKKVSKEQVELLKLSEEDTFVCLDSALDDSTKINIRRNLNVKIV